MGILKITLARSDTIAVATILILIAASGGVLRTPVDIFLPINIPVVAAVFGAMSPDEMAERYSPCELEAPSELMQLRRLQESEAHEPARARLALQVPRRRSPSGGPT